jgi:uncharacterized protein YfiM (DUF2279 family)
MRFALVLALWGGPHPRSVDDPWFGRDKFLHVAASALIQGAAHAALRANGRDYGQASNGAAVLTAVAGIGKELWDRSRGRDASFRDLTWDAVGGVSAAVAIRQVDR